MRKKRTCVDIVQLQHEENSEYEIASILLTPVLGMRIYDVTNSLQGACTSTQHGIGWCIWRSLVKASNDLCRYCTLHRSDFNQGF